MNENMAAFITELRTTDKPQAQGRLRRGEGFCCLGIATELAIARGGAPGWSFSPFHECYRHTTGEFEATHLPQGVNQWLGSLRDPVLVIPASVREALSASQREKLKKHVDGDAKSATWLNDYLKLTFAQIADCFEATFGGDGESATAVGEE